MCLLTVLKENAELEYSDAKEAAKTNPHGFGFAIHTKVGIIHDKDMDFEKLWVRWENMRETYKGFALWHFRITTHGGTNIENCHPFVTEDGQSVLAHNGILPLTMPVNDHRSDTRIFTEVVLPAIGGVEVLDNKEDFAAIQQWAAGNKIAILSSNPKTKYNCYIINEQLGHWKKDVWFSNHSYVKTVYTPYRSYGSYGTYNSYNSYSHDGGWDDDYLSPTPKNPNQLEFNLEELDKQDEWLETQFYLEEELYPNIKIRNQIAIFTEYPMDAPAKITCYSCGSVVYIDPEEEISPTHCGDCFLCLVCGNHKCTCWDDYEYSTNYFVWDKDIGECIQTERELTHVEK